MSVSPFEKHQIYPRHHLSTPHCMHCTVYCKVSRSRPKIPYFGCTYIAVREPPRHPVSSFFFLSPSFLVSRHHEPAAATAHRIFPSVPSSPSSPHFVYFPPSRSSADARKAGKKEGKFPWDLGLRPSDHRRRRGGRCMLNIYLVGSPTLSLFFLRSILVVFVL